MAYTAIDKSTDYFVTNLWTGNNTAQTITGIPFAPSFVWIKNRSTAESHTLVNTAVGANNFLKSNATSGNNTNSEFLKSFTSDGYTLGSADEVNNGSNNIVGWNWKGGTTSGIATNGTTTITPSAYSFDQTSGFSVIKYTGNGVDGAYLPHGLGVSPQVMIVKRSTDDGYDWYMYHVALGNQKYMQLNTANGVSGTDGMWGSFTPTSVNMKMSNDAQIGVSSKDYVMYCFAQKQGFSRCNSYIGNGNADGTFVFTGFSPAVVIMKNVTNGSTPWLIWDNKRPGYNLTNLRLRPNTTDAEDTSTADPIDFLSNGFKCRGSNDDSNKAGSTFMYIAFAESPFVSSTGIPTTAR